MRIDTIIWLLVAILFLQAIYLYLIVRPKHPAPEDEGWEIEAPGQHPDQDAPLVPHAEMERALVAQRALSHAHNPDLKHPITIWK